MAVVAVICKDYTAFLGPIAVTSTGFNWRLFTVLRDTQTNRKEILQNYAVDTLDADNLVTIRNKIIAGTQTVAQALNPPMTITHVSFGEEMSPVITL